MGKRIDLTGQRFGRLTVISLNEEVSKQKKKSHWNCKCDCGNEIVVCSGSLKSGATTDCGCSRKKELIGQRFVRLTVINYNEEVSKQKKGSYWDCKCDCGNEVIVHGSSLRSGHTKSCGCYNRDKAKETMKEKLQDEEFRQKKRNGIKEKWQNKEFRQIQSDKIRELNEKMWQDEEYRQMQSDKMRRLNEEMTGENSPNWKGGITPISTYLRGLLVVSQWRKDTYIRENNRCQLTGKKVHGGNSDVHHLYGFNMIVLEAHELHNIQIKSQVKDYTEKELHKLEEYVTSWHKDTSNAVLLSEEVHNLFHSLYGYGNNTPEQFEEFRERYIAGEFKDLI